MTKFQSFKDFTGLPNEAKGAVVALGNFDGLHRGHQEVIKKTVALAKQKGVPSGVGLFRPHPVRFFRPDLPPFRLMSAATRERLLPTLGLNCLFEIPFTDSLREMDDEAFVTEVLRDGLGALHIVVGADFKFGKDRCGDGESLERLCQERGIGVTLMEPLGLHKIYGKYGSTPIREAIKEGDVFHAAHMLSRPWSVDGIVEKGQQKGRTIGFPTANVDFGDLIRPEFGVYCVEVLIEGETERRPGVANAGIRPTVGGEAARVEVHIFDFNQDIYGKKIDVFFRSFIRPEIKFESFEVLKEQIEKDAQGARAVFGLLD